MWKFYVIIALLIPLINGQHSSYNTSGLTSSTNPLYFNIPNFKSIQRPNLNNMYSVAALPTLPPPPANTPAHIQNTNIPNANNADSKQSTFDVYSTISSPPPPIPPIREITTTESFNSKVFKIISLTAQHHNLVYSPISLQTLLSFIFAVSEGKLFEELQHLLAVTNNPTHVANTLRTIINDPTFNTPPTTLIMANKLYYDYRFGSIDQNTHKMALNSFASELEQIDFETSTEAANIINTWVSKKTRNLIQNIITPSTISPNSNAVLLNSIYFKGDWLKKFSTYDTQVQQFHVNRQQQVPVDMMYNEDTFRYGDFLDDLQASVVELPYQASNLTMMLILPTDVEGLMSVEQKLPQYNLEVISQKLKRHLVTVKLPKFNIEYDVDMVKPLQQLGLNALFNNDGKISLFENQQKPLTVDQLKHKSYISVNEVGTEAAAATFAKYVPLSIQVNMKYFVADHPFIFVIRSPNATFFIGHVVKF